MVKRFVNSGFKKLRMHVRNEVLVKAFAAERSRYYEEKMHVWSVNAMEGVSFLLLLKG